MTNPGSERATAGSGVEGATIAPATALSSASRPESFLDPRQALACIHCGLCLSSCPTYLETGDENNSPRGRIHLMRAWQEGRLEVAGEPVRHLDLCLGCRACEAACPSGVEYGALLEATREHIEQRHERSPWQQFLRRVLIEQIFPFPERMELALLPARLMKKLRLEAFLPSFAREALRLIPDEITADDLPEFSPASPRAKARGRVGFIRGCVMSVMFGATNTASVRLLNRAGYDVITPRAQGCCGALHAHGGRLAQARDAARRNVAAFEQWRLDAIVINAAGCGSTLKEYHHLLRDNPAWAERAEDFRRKVRDLSEWLVAAGLNWAPRPADAWEGKVTFHDACHLAHAQRISREPRQLVRAVAGENFVELPEADVCCGSAGSYNLTEPEMAARLQRRKVENVLETGARLVVSTNPGCLLQIRAGLDRAGATQVETMHLADFLDRFSSSE
jgi:glycolate oxidase iron-sulfur subunit